MPKSKKKKNIGFDFDEVILNHRDNKIKIASFLGVNLRQKDTPSDIVRFKMPPPTHEHFQNLLYHHPQYALGAPLFGGAKFGLAEIKRTGASCFLISRHPNPVIATEIMKQKGLWPSIFNEENAYFVNTKEDKNLKAKELRIEIYIDDQPSVLEAMTSVPHRFLFDPLGVYSGFSGDYEKIYSWKDFVEKVKKIL